jgi:hypothetical protein
MGLHQGKSAYNQHAKKSAHFTVMGQGLELANETLSQLETKMWIRKRNLWEEAIVSMMGHVFNHWR